jgi:mono/diheme cytochrome c family protein
MAMFGIYALFNLLQALRSSSAVLGFTDWVAALETLLILGPFTFVLLALLRLAAPDVFGGPPAAAKSGYRLALAGMVLTVGAMALAGVQTGFTWAGAANTAEFPNHGDGWVSTVGPLAGNYVAQLIGLVIVVIGLALAVRAVLAATGADSMTAEPIAAADPEPDLVVEQPPLLSKVRRYAYGFFALAALIAFVLPAFESADPTLLADNRRTYEPGSLVATGRSVYIQEGCIYCHTQQVRPIVTDVGLGPVSVLGDYAKETPVLIGVQRYGPDLMFFSDREGDRGVVQAHLQSPRDARPWSLMPGYDHLSTDDLAALAAYLVGEE